MSPETSASRSIGVALLAVLVCAAGAAAAQETRASSAGAARADSALQDTTKRPAGPIAVARVREPAVPVPAADLLTQLVGRLPGLFIFSASGRPGREPDALVRGPTSLDATGRSQAPLYVVDGVIIHGGLAAIDPQDVASVEVVRGAAAAAAYGLQGGRGVVRIATTQRDAGTGLALRFRAEAGASDIEHPLELARQHALLTDQTGRRFCIADATQPLCARTLDWDRETERVNETSGDYAETPSPLAFDPGTSTSGPALRQRFLASYWPVKTYDPVRQVAVSRPYVSGHADAATGGTGTRVSASASYLREAGAIRFLDGFTRYTGRLNVDRAIGGRVQLALRAFMSHGASDGVDQEGSGSMFYRLTRQPASADLLRRNALGRLYARSNIMSQGDRNANPLLYTTANGVLDRTTDTRFLGGATLRWSPTPWADVEAAISFDHRADRYERAIPVGFRTQGLGWPDYHGFLESDSDGHDGYDASLGVTGWQQPVHDLDVRWSLRALVERVDTRRDQLSGDSLANGGIVGAATVTADTTRTSERLVGLVVGVTLGFRRTFVADLVLRRDGSSLPGTVDRWATFGRAALAYRMSEERWWPSRAAVSAVTLRTAYGTAGSPPAFRARFETYLTSPVGVLYPGQLANPALRPERSAEFTAGSDVELFRRVGLTITYARTDTWDQILPVTPPAGTGFPTQWQNVGTLRNRTWELSVNVPVIRRRDLSWSWRFNYDRTRTMITKLDIAPYFAGAPTQGAGSILRIGEGERYGTIYGGRVLIGYDDCAKLPSGFRSRCGPGLDFQVNDDGYLVWTGGRSLDSGLANNLWMAKLPAAQAPWGAPLSWGMLITERDTLGARVNVPIGNALPDFRFSISSNFQWRRLTVYALLEAVIGRDVWNEGRHWSYLDFINADMDQRGRDPGLAKPLGYYFRVGPPDHGSGIGGLYQMLSPYNHMVEDASFAKLRELSVSYRLGRLVGRGDWEISLTGRNVFTLTGYRGWDPEVGYGGGTVNSATVNAVDAYTFPNLRTVAVALSARY